MPAAARHSKPRRPASKLGISIVAAAALASVAAALVYLNGPSGASQAADRPLNALATGTSQAATSGMTGDQLTVDYRQGHRRPDGQSGHPCPAPLPGRAGRPARPAGRPSAGRPAGQAAAHRAAQRQPGAHPVRRLGPGPFRARRVCIRNAEEGGSYAWGPGNGGGAYQFALGTWEKYGGAASEFGVAGPAYQDQIFDNAINAGGASNWTAYDGC